MSRQDYQFFVCENPECGLRFPGFDGYPRWNRCPLCRSNILQVEHIEMAFEDGMRHSQFKKLSIEVMLDNIRSAMNVGSIFRTSDGAGIKKLYCGGITPTPDNPKVRKTALGAESFIQWESHRNGLKLAQQLQKNGNKLWALEDAPQSIPLYHITSNEVSSPIVLIVGNELSGVDPGILRICDKVISIPMSGQKKSLNVAIAYGIAVSFLFYRLMYDGGN